MKFCLARRPAPWRTWLAMRAALGMAALCAAPVPALAQPAAPASSAATATATAPALPGGWQSVAGADAPRVPPARPVLPATVQSDDGASTTVRDLARVIAAADDVIEVMEVLGLAASVHAAPERSATAAGARAPHKFLFNRTTGIEGVLSLGGSTFIGNSLRRHARLAAALRDAGMGAVVVDDLQPAPAKVRKIAAALGLPAQGEALATAVQVQLDEAAAIAAASPRRPRVILLSATGGGGKPAVAGRDSAAAAQIRLAGGLNIGDEGGVADYGSLSNEGVVAAAPEVILISRHDLELLGGEAGLWAGYPTLRQTPAGAANRVWVMPDAQIKTLGVSAGTGAVALARALARQARAAP